MGTTLLQAALKYREIGYSVIPIRHGQKKPYIKWEPYQHDKAGEKEIRTWWKKWPKAGVAIVTGEISGVYVVDIDSEGGLIAFKDLVPDSLVTCIANSPRGGWHYYFSHKGKRIGPAVGFIENCDFRGDGSYIIAPPSIGENGRPYSWEPKLHPIVLAPAELPATVASELLRASKSFSSSSYTNSLYRGDNIAKPTQGQHLTTKDNIGFDKGNRDETLFRLANYLAKGGMHELNIEKYLSFFASHCNPPFPKKEFLLKIQSALKRAKRRERTLTQEIRDWVMATNGNFLTTFLYNCQHLTTRDEKKKAHVILGRLVKEGLLERVEGRAGCYRRVDRECEAIDWINADTEPFQILWPFKLHEMVKIMPKNVIVLAGTQNAGKTTFVLNVIKLNMNRGKEIIYFSSEMGGAELRTRIENFDIPLEEWKFQVFERSHNFADVIRPEAINIIDYLELSDAFYIVAQHLMDIYQRLKGGIAIVCLQKDPKAIMGRGGTFGLEKPRLYMNLDGDPPDGAVLQIIKAKNRAKKDLNPNQYKTRFKILNGAKLIQQGEWYLG